MGQVGVYPQSIQFPIISISPSKYGFLKVGKWQDYADAHGLGTTKQFVVNHLFARPILISRRSLITGIGIRVATGVAGSKVYWGVYDDDGSCYPGKLLESGDLSGATAVNRLDNFSRIFEPGLYWQALGSAHTPTIKGIETSVDQYILGLNDFTSGGTDGASGRFLDLTMVDITAGLPDPFTAGAIYDVGSNAPAAWLYLDSYL
jgi:hypothetical protein